MLTISKRYSLALLGSFRLVDADGRPVAITSKKSMAMMAMLATSPNGERRRAWVQERLWGSREDAQARASMRRELSNLHKALGAVWEELLQVDARCIRLKLEKVSVDVVRVSPEGFAPAGPTGPDAEFLEGISLRGEAGFRDWLALVRTSLDFTCKASPSSLKGLAPWLESKPSARAVRAVDASVAVWLPPVEELAGLGQASTLARACAHEVARWLARVRWLRVVSGQTKAGKGYDAAQLDPATSYIVERLVHRTHLQESVELRLLRADTFEIVWAENAPIPRAPAPNLPSLFLTGQLVARIEREEQTRAMLAESSHDFKTLIWNGRRLISRLTRPDAALAARLIELALSLAPDAPEAIIQKAIVVASENWSRPASEREFGALVDLARRCMLADPDDCRGYWLAGIGETWRGNSAAAIAWLRRAIEIDPTFEPAYAQLGSTLNRCNRSAEALDVLTLSGNLSPNGAHAFLRHSELALSTLQLGRYAESKQWADRALLLRPDYALAKTIAVQALVETGNHELARSLAADLQLTQPGFDEEFAGAPFIDRLGLERIVENLRNVSAAAQ